jgi:hypothetical protein
MRGPPMKSFMMFSIASACIALTGCSSLTRRSPTPPSPLVSASCPDLTPLIDDSFGSTTLKLVEVAGIYYQCRQAALATGK